MKKIFLFLFVIISFARAQDASNDSLIFFHKLEKLLAQNQFASVQIELDKRIQKEGMKPVTVCMMVKNGLQHFYRQENYEIFYLKNLPLDDSGELKPARVRIVRLRYPRRLLRQLLQRNPNVRCAYELLGDYYNLQLQDLSDFDFFQSDKIAALEEKIFTNYTEAVKRGSEDKNIFLWLGEYYLKAGRPVEAETYFQKNIARDTTDAISLLRLAEIKSQEKEYTQSYNLSASALRYFSRDDIYLKYDAIRLAAGSLLHLGDVQKFLHYMKECTQLLPDVQDAYIDLMKYYVNERDTIAAENTLEKMLLNNPFDLQGYGAAETFITRQKQYAFAESLFENMLLKYENWDEVLANIYWLKGDIAQQRGNLSDAKKFWGISQNYMRHYLPEDSPLLKKVGEVSLSKVGQ